MTSKRLLPIVIDARMLFQSGIGTVIRNVLQRKPSEVEASQITVLSSGEDSRQWIESQLPGVQHAVFDAPIYSLREQLWSLSRVFLRPSVLWVPHYNIPFVWSGPILSTVHDVLPLALPELFSGSLKQIYARTMFKHVAKKAARIICNSRFTVDEFQRFTDCPSGKIKYALLGVDQSWFQDLKCKPEESQFPYLVYVGNIKPHKNLKNLLKAFALMRSSRPDLQLYLVGKKEGFITGSDEALQLAKQETSGVSFLGQVSEEKLRLLVQSAEALVMPSLYEGFGLPALEAMASRCLVAVSDIPVFREVCGSHAVYFDPVNPAQIAETLLTLLAEASEKKKSRREAALAAARLMSWGPIAELHWSAIQDLRSCE